jgi:hypothetical protein
LKLGLTCGPGGDDGSRYDVLHTMTVFTYFILHVTLVNLQFAQCSQQVNNYNYLGCQISYENKPDIEQKLTLFVQILGILKQFQMEFHLECYKNVRI